jgi:acetyl esterase/lipase
MAAITHESSGDNFVPPVENLLKYVKEHAAELKIDPKRIAFWACSANARAGTELLAAHDELRAAVFYYGAMQAEPKNVATPVFVARAGLDALPLNESIDRWVARAVALAGSGPRRPRRLSRGHLARARKRRRSAVVGRLRRASRIALGAALPPAL